MVIAVLTTKACQGEKRNGLKTPTTNLEPHSGHLSLDGFLS